MKPFSIGMNCAFGAEQLRPPIAQISKVADTHVSVYANAGLPNAMGEYDETPEFMADAMRAWATDGLLNIVGGCCGTARIILRLSRKLFRRSRHEKSCG